MSEQRRIQIFIGQQINKYLKFELKNKINPREKKLSEFVIFFLTIELLSVFACLSNDRQGGKRVNSGRVFFFYEKRNTELRGKREKQGKKGNCVSSLFMTRKRLMMNFSQIQTTLASGWAASSKRRNCLVNGLLG